MEVGLALNVVSAGFARVRTVTVMRLNSTAFPVLTSCGDWLPPAPRLAVAPQRPGARKQQRPRTDMLKKVVLNQVLLPFHAGTASAASGEAAPEEAESLLTSTSSLCGRAADMLAGLVDVVERQSDATAANAWS